MSRDKGRGRNGFYKLVLHPKPCAEHSGLETLGTRSTWVPMMPLPSSVTLEKPLTPSEHQALICKMVIEHSLMYGQGEVK